MELLIESANLKHIAGKLERRLHGADCTVHATDGMLEVRSQNSLSTVRCVDFHNGLSLSAIDLLFNQDMTLKFEPQDSPLHFVYCLEGWCNLMNIYNEMQYQIKPGQVIIYSVKGPTDPLLTLPAFQKVKLVVLQIARQQFLSHKSIYELPKTIRRIFEDVSGSTPYFYHGQFGSTLAECLVRVLNNAKKGFIGELLLEARGMEILGLQLDQYTKETTD